MMIRKAANIDAIRGTTNLDPTLIADLVKSASSSYKELASQPKALELVKPMMEEMRKVTRKICQSCMHEGHDTKKCTMANDLLLRIAKARDMKPKAIRKVAREARGDLT